MKMITNSLIVMVFFGITNLATAMDETMSAMQVESTVITFNQGKSNVTNEDISRLRSAITDAASKGKLEAIEVAVWSDKEHPISGDLPKVDVKLAKQRIDTIKKTISKDLGRKETVKSYNMAETTNWLGRYFNTKEAELDAVFAKKEADSLERNDLALIKKDGAPSKAVIVMKYREK